MRFPLILVAVLFGLAQLATAGSVAICRTPAYDVCCDDYASPYLWPSGSGCCIGGVPYAGTSCPLLLATPTPTPTPSPTVPPASAPASPQANFVLSCPLAGLEEKTMNFSAFMYDKGIPSYDAGMKLRVLVNGSFVGDVDAKAPGAPEMGRHDFTLDTNAGGAYNVQAQSGALTSNNCTFSVKAEQATPAPETGLEMVVAAGLLALLLVRKK